MSKKVRGVVAKFDIAHQFGKKMGLPDPSGDLLYGSDRALSPTEAAEKAAKEAGSSTVDQPAEIPTAVSDDTLAAREAQRRRQLALAGMSGNVLTGSMGLASPASTQMKSLLGS